MLVNKELVDLVVCSLAVSAISWTVTKSTVFIPLRKFISGKSAWLFQLITCPYCFSHYLALAAVLLVKYQPVATQYVVVNYIISVFATVTLASAFTGYLIRYAFQFDMKEYEQIEHLTNLLEKSKEVISKLKS